MKKLYIIIAVILAASPIYAKRVPKAHQMEAPYVSVYNIFGGASTLYGGGAPNYTLPLSTLVIDGHIPIGEPFTYVYLQARFTFYMGESSFPLSSVLPIAHMENTKVGLLIGGGAIVKDCRIRGKGLNVMVNGGMLLDIGIENKYTGLTADLDSLPSNTFVGFGAEINTIIAYNFTKHFGINFGLHLGYMFNPFSGDAFYSGRNSGTTYFQTIHYGLSLGIQM